MLFPELRESVFKANMELNASGLVLYTFGNVSGIDRAKGVVVIKPSGVSYDRLSAEAMVCVELETGKIVDSKYSPSTDTPTHLEIYRSFAGAGGVVHTHSCHATACAQARHPVRCMGTTHADYFCGDIPVTRPLTREETVKEYERNTGLVIVETFRDKNPAEIQAVLVANHGPFAWGSNEHDAVHHAVVLEYLARIDVLMHSLGPTPQRPAVHLIEKHYFRKHGKAAYYGQKEKS
jgi:L-ribulose-5-phosphate 4-epimerase